MWSWTAYFMTNTPKITELLLLFLWNECHWLSCPSDLKVLYILWRAALISTKQMIQWGLCFVGRVGCRNSSPHVNYYQVLCRSNNRRETLTNKGTSIGRPLVSQKEFGKLLFLVLLVEETATFLITISLSLFCGCCSRNVSVIMICPQEH